MTRSAVAVLLFSFLVAWHYRQDDGIVVPYGHPASPHAESAPPIQVPAIQGGAEKVTPDVAKEAPGSTQQPQAPSSGDAGAHQHHH